MSNTARSDYSSVRMELLETYYVVSQYAYDASDPDERQNRRHLKDVLNDALQNNDQKDMLDALVYVLAWINGDLHLQPPAWAKLLTQPICALPVGTYSGRVNWRGARQRDSV
jgi:hypothetical protein